MKLKMVVASVAGVVALVVTAGPAFADCVNLSRPDKANVQIAAHSPALSSVSQCLYGAITPCTPHLTFDNTLLIFFETPASIFPGPLSLGLCPLGAQYLVDRIHDAAALPGSSIDLTWVVGGEALQSGGLENASNPRAQQNTSNGKGIDLFRENAEILAVIDANIAKATGMC